MPSLSTFPTLKSDRQLAILALRQPCQLDPPAPRLVQPSVSTRVIRVYAVLFLALVLGVVSAVCWLTRGQVAPCAPAHSQMQPCMDGGE